MSELANRSRVRRLHRSWALAAFAALILAPTASAAELRIVSGSTTVTVRDDPWTVVFSQPGGAGLREERGLGYRDGSGWHRALRARSLVREGNAVVAVVETEGGRAVSVRLAPAGDGVISLHLGAPAGARATGEQFVSEPGERFFGTGERSDAVNRRGRETENYVSDGPFREEDRQYVRASTPPWAARDRDDSTYFPIPWTLSSRGWGVLIDENATSRLQAGTTRPDRWGVDADGARLRLRVFAGPTPAAALRRFTAGVGRQPAPQAPWTFGPWFQTGQPNVVPVEEERAITKVQRDAGVPVSVAETQMHYLPCGAHKGREAAERERTDSFHRDGLARLVYFNPLLCASYTNVFNRAASAGVLQKGLGGLPFLYPAFVGGSGPAGFTEEPLAQFDFTHPATKGFYTKLVREAVDGGADGWMEDFGESTPPSIVQHDGSTGDAAHNRYPTDYHCALSEIASGFDRPLVRFLRSGWTGTARCSEVVWGGDPTTLWGFDGLSSAATQALSMGLSGVNRWGTDIGGYNSFGSGRKEKPGATEDETLTPELLTRWIEFGALVPVMRTKRSGIALPSYKRPQVFDPEQLPVWRRLTELHHQLNPYLRAADGEYRATGLPTVRHLVLAHPGLEKARAADDQWLFGPNLLAAPVTAPGVRKRSVWLPPGRWVNWWRSVSFTEPTGAYRLRKARVLRGRRDHPIDAPLGQPPLLLRVGSVLPLLGADVDTLSPYGSESRLVRLADRSRRMRLLAVPRGRTRSRLPDGGAARSVEGRRRWVLRVSARRSMRWSIEASMRTLRRPFRPRRVLVRGRVLSRRRWSYNRRSGVLRVAVRGARVRLDVRRR